MVWAKIIWHKEYVPTRKITIFHANWNKIKELVKSGTCWQKKTKKYHFKV